MVVVALLKLPLKLPENVVAVTVPPEELDVPLLKLVAVPVTFPVIVPVTVKFEEMDSLPVMANVPPEGVIALMVDETGPTYGLRLVEVFSPVNKSIAGYMHPINPNVMKI
jgi:hypothetical protein